MTTIHGAALTAGHEQPLGATSPRHTADINLGLYDFSWAGAAVWRMLCYQ